MRGTPCPCPCPVKIPGIIPACAGNTSVSSPTRTSRWDHPRVCGEHAAAVESAVKDKGSSPRVRGTLVFRLRLHLPLGIIPACAGNTLSVMAARFALRGSSPRVRGTRRNHRQEWHVYGIIPACAGNTVLSEFVPTSGGDHPRVCGEHSESSSTGTYVTGSSPRVRGTPL